MSWNAENEAYRCMVDRLVRMLIKGDSQYDIEKEVAKRAKDLDIESQLTFVTNFNYIIERLWYINRGD